jgi:hypothetical protein
MAGKFAAFALRILFVGDIRRIPELLGDWFLIAASPHRFRGFCPPFFFCGVP